ncbi:MAG: recombinase family protein [Saprospiraceae bacterium]|nr:recombinase family protein [Saprospiraceae bacterium]
MAESESNKISERTRDGINQANRMGYFTGTAPYGYTRKESEDRTTSGKKRKVLVPDENAPFVKDLFQRFADREDRGDLFTEYSKNLEIRKSQFYRLSKTLFTWVVLM